MTPRDRLILALDVETTEETVALAEKTAPWVGTFKLGPGHVLEGAAGLIEAIKGLDRKVFLDMKLYDIPETVCRTCAHAARMGVDFLTLHAAGGTRMIQAAREAAEKERKGDDRLKLLAVTVLTSFGEDELKREWRLAESVGERVAFWADLASKSGADGVVCSSLELDEVRSRVGTGLLKVVPGIRSAKDAAGDQRRTMSAGEAVARGASMVVVGRPVIRSPDPAAAARNILKEIEEAR